MWRLRTFVLKPSDLSPNKSGCCCWDCLPGGLFSTQMLSLRMKPSAQSQWKEPSSLMQASLRPGHAISRSLHSSTSERRQEKSRFQGHESWTPPSFRRWEERREVTEAFGSFQAVATGAFLTAGGTAAHAADARLVTAWKTTKGNFSSKSKLFL